jgi:hypothetical protein
VVIGGWNRGHGSAVCRVLVVHALMIVFAVTEGLIVMAREVVLDAGSDRQLQPRALPPRRRAGDKRKRNGQNQNMAKNATHHMMLAGPAKGRHQFFRWSRL